MRGSIGRIPSPTKVYPKVFYRTLFLKFKKKPSPSESKTPESFHHEYSIRPDNFAFKVNNKKETKDAILNNAPKNAERKPHPLQKNNLYSSFNLMNFIYKNATNYPFQERSPQDIFDEYPMTKVEKLSRLNTRPKKVKMLTSDFIEDSLYNPHYGYFSKEVEIFHREKPFDYNNITDVDEFLENWERSYEKYEEQEGNTGRPLNSQVKGTQDIKNVKSTLARRALEIDIKERNSEFDRKVHRKNRSMQLWHTPTELFQPYYGEALARYLLVNYKLNGHYPYKDLIIYEMGGGNGTLMCNILNYIKENQPDVYARTQYKIIEILSLLAEKQMENALKQKLVKQGLDSLKLEIINKSIFDWDKTVTDPCFFIALEVFDNFPHDLIRYDNETGVPHEGNVLIDKHGDFYEFFTPQLSYYSQAFLNLRENGSFPILKNQNLIRAKKETLKSLIPFLTDKDKIHPLYHSPTVLSWKNSILPFKDNLSAGEFIPTRLIQFFQILKHRFPHHSLIASDFHYLPNSIEGYYNAPVVQTYIQDRMVSVTTYMCLQGYFDIMFPTDFKLCADMYKQITGRVPRVESHREFLEDWADTEITTTKKGENPMLDFYANASFIVS